jgi:hypothetical protein
LGGSDLNVYVTDPLRDEIKKIYDTLDAAIQNALDKIVSEDGDIVYEPKSLADISTTKPNLSQVNMNN